MQARRLTKAGVERFEDFLERLKANPNSKLPTHALTDDRLSEPVEIHINVEPMPFATRMEVAKHVFALLRRDPETLRIDKGFWCWLSLFWFNNLCPQTSGSRSLGDRYRWIAELDNTRRAYRHLLAGPYQIYRAHRDDPERARALLCGPVHQQGELLAQIASRPSLVTSKAVVAVATLLYYNRETDRLCRGCGGKGPGSARRFADILSQLDLTWDLHSLTVKQLLELLPDEFDSFRSRSVKRQQLLFAE